MEAKKWEKKLTEACKAVGLYRKEYVSVIAAAAEIFEQRDLVLQEYRETGSQPVIEVEGSTGQTKTVKNPLLQTWLDLNKSALSYWSELGLTPASFKKITGDQSRKDQKGNALLAALESLG